MNVAALSPEPEPGTPPAWEAVALIGGGIVLLAALVVWAWWTSGAAGRRLSVDDRKGAPRTEGPYAGTKACANCHPGESALYSRSGHARTLQPAAASPAARRLDGRTVNDPERPGVTWSYALRGGTLEASRAEAGRGELERFVLEYALGSGHHAVTFVTVTDPRTPAALEHRLTYRTATDSLGITPGQRADAPAGILTDAGRALTSRDTLRCFGCHATPADAVLATAPGQAPVPELGPLTPNVTCERCHGPARAHSRAAAAAGTGSLPPMPFGPDGATAQAEIGLCGQCHRHPARFPASRIRPDDPQLARFQPIGLTQSSCFTRGSGTLRCTTCHDPHARASTDRAVYEAVCLLCHGAGPSPASGGPTPGPSCSVSPRGGCVACHMPKVDPGQGVLFTDHWIRVR